MQKLLTLLVLFTLSVGCTDAGMSRLKAYGDSAYVECYSGGKLIYKGRSTGKVLSEANSDGYLFRDAKDNVLKEVSGNCVITYGDTPASETIIE